MILTRGLGLGGPLVTAGLGVGTITAPPITFRPDLGSRWIDDRIPTHSLLVDQLRALEERDKRPIKKKHSAPVATDKTIPLDFGDPLIVSRAVALAEQVLADKRKLADRKVAEPKLTMADFRAIKEEMLLIEEEEWFLLN